jgi:[glutamine synthetase] adenylyltransferase / [glutamine synthetase]-adenylyl-L-tyrosine phosphorylase
VLGSLVSILSHAPTLAEALGQQPSLLDALIDSRVKADVPELGVYIQHIASATMGKPYEAQLDIVRQIVGDHRFALGVQLIEGHADPITVSRGYSDLAEAALITLADATIAEFRTAHGKVPDSELIILALGRFGGRALTHASDLDLIYLFTGDFLAESDGPKPLGATLYYTRLAQRISAAMSVPTASGRLYEVDTRLRPSGADGPMVVSVESFERYQHEAAWTWEHMALTRARVVYGSASGAATVDQGIAHVLMQQRDPAKLIADAGQMRRDMAAHKPAKGPLDVKMGEGGLVDLEFAVHVTQLRTRSGFDPDLDRAIMMLIEADAAPASTMAAYHLLARLLVVLRLAAPTGMPAPATEGLIAEICGLGDWDAIMTAMQAAQGDIARWWRTMQDSTVQDRPVQDRTVQDNIVQDSGE